MPFTPYPSPGTAGQEHQPFGASGGTFVNEGPDRWAPKGQGGAASAPPEVILSTSDLTGAAPAGAKFGMNTSNDKMFKVVGGNWVEIPIGGGIDLDLNAVGGSTSVSGLASFQGSSGLISDMVVTGVGSNISAYIPPATEKWMLWFSGLSPHYRTGNGADNLSAFRQQVYSATTNTGWMMRLK